MHFKFKKLGYSKMSGSIWYSRYVSEKKYKLLLFEHIFSTVFKIIVEII